MLVEAEPGIRPRLFFQLVPEAKVVRNRLHLDLRCGAGNAGVQAEVDKIVSLGGRLVVTHDDHLVLAGPEGNEFCLQR